jgi:hypothetical protein
MERKEHHGRFTKDFLPESAHVCLIYTDEGQRQKIVSEYLAAGIVQGELVYYFTDKTNPEEIRSWFLELGVTLPEDEKKGSFSILNAECSYCPKGCFEPEELLEGMASRYVAAKKAGYSGSRVSGEMTWALRGLPGSDRLLEYEVGINMITTPFPHSGMCQYDARLFDGATLFNILQVHPFMIAQGQVVSNPFYLKPEEFLAKHNSQKT